MASVQKRLKSAPTVETFNYNEIEPDLAKLLRNRAQRIKSQIRQQTKSIIETGQILREVKSRLEHGQFSAWVQSELGHSVRTAENYMRAAAFADGKKSEIISLLPPATIYALAAPSTPDNVKDTVLNDLEAGKGVNIRSIENQIRLAKETKHSTDSSEALGYDSTENARAAIAKAHQILRESLPDQAFHTVCICFTNEAVLSHPTHSMRLFKDFFSN